MDRATLANRLQDCLDESPLQWRRDAHGYREDSFGLLRLQIIEPLDEQGETNPVVRLSRRATIDTPSSEKLHGLLYFLETKAPHHAPVTWHRRSVFIDRLLQPEELSPERLEQAYVEVTTVAMASAELIADRVGGLPLFMRENDNFVALKPVNPRRAAVAGSLGVEPGHPAATCEPVGAAVAGAESLQ